MTLGIEFGDDRKTEVEAGPNIKIAAVAILFMSALLLVTFSYDYSRRELINLTVYLSVTAVGIFSGAGMGFKQAKNLLQRKRKAEDRRFRGNGFNVWIVIAGLFCMVLVKYLGHTIGQQVPVYFPAFARATIFAFFLIVFSFTH